jgi:hypothetical protein
MSKPIGYYASASSGTKDNAILSEIESKYGSWLEKLTPSQKSAWAIALLTEAVEPEGIEVDYSIDGIPQLKQLFKLSDGCKLHLALAVLMYLRVSVLAQSRAGKC